MDSPLIDDYPVIRMERLAVKGQIGKDKGTGDGSTWTASDLYDEMRAKAEERFSIDHADQVIHEVTVDFEMLGSTDEYAELKNLERVLLYDTVSVEEEEISLSIRLTVTELEWDPLKKKVVALKLSNGNGKGGKNVTGYNVQAKSIGSDKLADEVAESIVQQAVDLMPEYADPNASRPSSNISVIDNLNSTSTTDALSANQGNVLNGNLEIEQHYIPATTTGTINTVAKLNAALRNSSMNTLAIDASYRSTLVSAGLIPVNSAGMWNVRKLSSNYMFMEYTTYNGRKFFASINNGTLSAWKELTTQ